MRQAPGNTRQPAHCDAGAARSSPAEDPVSEGLCQLVATDAARQSSAELLLVHPTPVPIGSRSSRPSLQSDITSPPEGAFAQSQLAPLTVLLVIGFTMLAFAAGFWLGRFVH